MERERDRDLDDGREEVPGIRRDVEDALVDEEEGDMIDSEEAVDAFDRLRPLCVGSFGPAGDTALPYRGRGPDMLPVVVSMARREYITGTRFLS